MNMLISGLINRDYVTSDLSHRKQHRNFPVQVLSLGHPPRQSRQTCAPAATLYFHATHLPVTKFVYELL
jgi:hypothetical protein